MHAIIYTSRYILLGVCAPDLIVQREVHLVHLEAKIASESDDESGDVDHVRTSTARLFEDDHVNK